MLQALTFLVSFVVITVLFAMIYKVLPNVNISWEEVWIGAAITAILFEIGKVLIGLYIGKTSVASSFGAAGPFVVLMLWLYYSTQIFLLGAEFTVAYALWGQAESARAAKRDVLRQSSCGFCRWGPVGTRQEERRLIPRQRLMEREHFWSTTSRSRDEDARCRGQYPGVIMTFGRNSGRGCRVREPVLFIHGS